VSNIVDPGLIPYSSNFRTIPGVINNWGGAKVMNISSMAECEAKCVSKSLCAAFAYSLMEKECRVYHATDNLCLLPSNTFNIAIRRKQIVNGM
jgi:hypothetical protein